jgi:L-seryl-tRNA(Ser) seleniumtransferase
MPGHTLPTPVVSIRAAQPDRVAAALRRARPPVVARVEEGAVVIDVRTVDPSDDETLIEALRRALA